MLTSGQEVNGDETKLGQFFVKTGQTNWQKDVVGGWGLTFRTALKGWVCWGRERAHSFPQLPPEDNVHFAENGDDNSHDCDEKQSGKSNPSVHVHSCKETNRSYLQFFLQTRSHATFFYTRENILAPCMHTKATTASGPHIFMEERWQVKGELLWDSGLNFYRCKMHLLLENFLCHLSRQILQFYTRDPLPARNDTSCMAAWKQLSVPVSCFF